MDCAKTRRSWCKNDPGCVQKQGLPGAKIDGSECKNRAFQVPKLLGLSAKIPGFQCPKFRVSVQKFQVHEAHFVGTQSVFRVVFFFLGG